MRPVSIGRDVPGFCFTTAGPAQMKDAGGCLVCDVVRVILDRGFANDVKLAHEEPELEI